MKALFTVAALVFGIASIFAASAGHLSDTPLWVIAALLAMNLVDRR